MKSKICLLILTLLFLIGCGEKKSSGTGGDGGKEVELRVMWWGSDARHKATLDAIKLFEEKNPGIKIKAEYSGYEGYLEKLSTQMSGKTAPDIMQVDWNWLYIFSKNGDGFYNVRDLKDFDLSNYDEAILNHTVIKDKLNAVPVGLNGMGFYYNQSVFDKAGAKFPESEDDLFAVNKMFKEKLGDDYYPLDVSDEKVNYYFINYYLLQKTGNNLINEENKIGITKEELADALRFYKRMVDEKVTLSTKDRAGLGNVPGDQNPLWVDGHIGGTYEWSSRTGVFQDTLKEGQVASGNYIKGIGDHNAAFIRLNMAFAVNKNTKHPEAAAKFLNFMLSDPEATKILGMTRGIPSNKKALEVLEQENMITGISKEVLDKALAYQGKMISPYYEDERLIKIFAGYVQKIDYGQIDIDKAAEGIIADMEAALKNILR